VTVFLSRFFLKEKIGLENIIAVVLITVGITVMFIDKVTFGSMTGNIMALASAFTFSLYFIFLRMQKDSSTIESVLISHILTVIICLSISLFLPFPKFSTVSIASILVLGIFQIGISSVLLSMAIKRISALTANLIAVIEPVFNPVWVFVVLGEKPGGNSLIGGALILVSVTAASFITAGRKKVESAES